MCVRTAFVHLVSAIGIHFLILQELLGDRYLAEPRSIEQLLLLARATAHDEKAVAPVRISSLATQATNATKIQSLEPRPPDA